VEQYKIGSCTYAKMTQIVITFRDDQSKRISLAGLQNCDNPRIGKKLLAVHFSVYLPKIRKRE